MSARERACGHCGEIFTAKTARGVYCSDLCRATAGRERQRRPANVVALPARAAADSIRAAVARELGDQAHTPTGRQALLLAGRLDAGPADAVLAPLSRRLGELMASAVENAAALAAAGQDDDPVEFLRARAEARRLSSV